MQPSLILSIVVSLFIQGCSNGGIVGAISQASFSNDQRSFEQQLNDSKIEMSLQESLSKDKKISKYTNISVVCFNHTVFLFGQAPNHLLIKRTLKNIKQHDEVKTMTIRNLIRTREPTTIVTRSEDAWISTHIKAKLSEHQHIDPSRIKVVTENKEVFLLGLVPKKQADQAVLIARQTNHVTKVIHAFELTKE